METKVTLYGASGHCKVIIDILNCNAITIEKVIDDNPKKNDILGLSILNSKDLDLNNLKNVILSIGNNLFRKKLASKLDINFLTAIHPTAIISKNVIIENGTVIMAGAIINPDTIIKKHCIINTGAIIEHDCLVNNFAHVSPGASLAGNVTIGEGTHVGIGAIVIQGVTIGKWATIGAGAIIIKDIPDYAVVVGNPGKIIKYNKENE
ncbi:acetyltransferase [Flavobacterium sp.]|uniref:acetyltransferase n=1 Tax=Flavobacterium sp. TaxID=239 RepID=UPI00375077AD